MSRRRERSEELSDLLYDALEAGLEHALVSAQRNDRDAQEFMGAYKEFYLNGKKPSLDLSVRAGKYVSDALRLDATPLHSACYRWSSLFTAAFGIASPIIAATRNWWYAAGALACAGIAYLARRAVRELSIRDASAVQSAIAFQPDVMKNTLPDSREYGGGILWSYGSISEEQIYRPVAKKPKGRRGSNI